VLKYANGLQPLKAGETVRILVFKILAGRTFHCTGKEMGCEPKPDYDSHMSVHGLEWYLPLEGQSYPAFVLDIKAVKLTGDGTADDGDSDGGCL
jgi:hypothetical protein